MPRLLPRLLCLLALIGATAVQGQTLTAVNGALQSTSAVFFPTTGAFFPRPAFTDAPATQTDRFTATLATNFVVTTATTAYSGLETYRYQLRLLNSQNTAVTLTNGSTTLTTSDFVVSWTQLRTTASHTQTFHIVPQVALPAASGNVTLSVVLQRKTMDNTGFPTILWVNDGTAVTLALPQEVVLPQLRVLSSTATEIRLAYNYSTTVGEEIYARWKLQASPSLAAGSFTQLSALTPAVLSPGVLVYTVPITPTTVPKQFFRLAN